MLPLGSRLARVSPIETTSPAAPVKVCSCERVPAEFLADSSSSWFNFLVS
jgi:hypothetical protein